MKQSAANKMAYRPIELTDMPFWLSMYADKDSQKQMYSAPIGNDQSFAEYIQKHHAFTVTFGERLIGGFTISRIDERMATFGFILHPSVRGNGYGGIILDMIQRESRSMGIGVLRADVYEDNYRSIGILESSGFRRFVWLEKNIQ